MDPALRLAKTGCVTQANGVRVTNRAKGNAPGIMAAHIQVDSIRISCQEKEFILQRMEMFIRESSLRG